MEHATLTLPTWQLLISLIKVPDARTISWLTFTILLTQWLMRNRHQYLLLLSSNMLQLADNYFKLEILQGINSRARLKSQHSLNLSTAIQLYRKMTRLSLFRCSFSTIAKKLTRFSTWQLPARFFFPSQLTLSPCTSLLRVVTSTSPWKHQTLSRPWWAPFSSSWPSSHSPSDVDIGT